MYTSFDNTKEGDITFLTETDVLKAENMLKDCRAQKVFVYDSILDFLKEEEMFYPPTAYGCKNPKLAFMKEVAEKYPHGTRPCIRHNGEQIDGPVHMVEDNIHIGVEPLNVERDENGELYDFTYLGGVQIGRNVQIGSNTTIARGALEDTIIEDNVRMDANVFVGNGALIGAGSIICVGVIIGGGVTIGRNCFIGLGAIINPHVSIADFSIIGSGSVVTKDITSDLDIVVGIPAKSIRDKSNLTVKDTLKMVGAYQRTYDISLK